MLDLTRDKLAWLVGCSFETIKKIESSDLKPSVQLAELLAGERWIMDGNFGGTREMRMQAADTIIFLDLPPRVCLYRILKRTVKYYGRSRPDMTAGCNEKLDLEFILWVWNYKHRSRKRLLAELEAVGDKRVIILKSRRQVREFLAAS